MAHFSFPEMPRPKSFLYVMSLRSGAELITMTILINKVSGFYGLLAVLTGLELSHTQLSMYLYSLAALFLTGYLYPFIRTQAPLECLALAYFYIIDSIINAAYTAAFAVAWFLVLAQHPQDHHGVPGSDTIDNTAGFTSPEHNVSSVDVLAVPKPGLTPGQDAVTIGQGSPDHPAGLSNALFQSGSIMSLSAIAALWAVRIYFIFVMLAYARSVLRHHIATTSSTQSWSHAAAPSSDDNTPSTNLNLAENPFAESRDEGAGWKGKLGRAMLKVQTRYWLGADEEEMEWQRGLGTRFNRKNNANVVNAPPGTVERERRRRSGTGPPAPVALPPFVGSVERTT